MFLPVGRMQNDDDLVPSLDPLFGNGIEIVALGDIEAIAQCDIDTPNPPIVRELEREIAALLIATPSADVLGLVTVLIGKRRKSIMPVVVAGDKEQLAIGLSFAFIRFERKRPVVGLEAALAIFLLGRVRIGHITAENQYLTGGKIQRGLLFV